MQVSLPRRSIALLAVMAGLAAVLPLEAGRAAPSTPTTLTYHFTGCTGPAAPSPSFDAVKQPGEAAGLQLTDGSATFVLMRAVDAVTGAVLFSTPGFEHNKLPTATCNLTNPRGGAEVVVTGLIAPVKK